MGYVLCQGKVCFSERVYVSFPPQGTGSSRLFDSISKLTNAPTNASAPPRSIQSQILFAPFDLDYIFMSAALFFILHTNLYRFLLQRETQILAKGLFLTQIPPPLTFQTINIRPRQHDGPERTPCHPHQPEQSSEDENRALAISAGEADVQR